MVMYKIDRRGGGAKNRSLGNYHSLLGLHNISTVSFTFNLIEDNAELIR